MAKGGNIKAVSDEEIIAALLDHGTVKAAAEAAGTTPRTVYDRMSNREFRAAYAEAKNDIIRKAVFTINERLADAINTVSEIMNDARNNPAIRLQAAQTIINNAGKFADRLTRDERESRNAGKDPLQSLFD
jgi:cell division septum initiation protein DivIVA